MKVFIMRGLPGSGKSTWIKNYIAAWCNSLRYQIVSADDYFLDNEGIYRFNSELLPLAHDYCLSSYITSLHQMKVAVIFVDCTNIRMYELAPYYRVAEALGVDVEIVHMMVDPYVAVARNIHGVPEEVVDRMARSFEPIPPWWKCAWIQA